MLITNPLKWIGRKGGIKVGVVGVVSQRNADTKANGASYAPYYEQQPPIAANGISPATSLSVNNANYPLYRPDTAGAYNFAVAAQDRQYSKYS